MPTRVKKSRSSAPVFAALGDKTRQRLLTALGGGGPMSIGRLGEVSPLSRQAITKHLRVLHSAGLIRRTRRGRQTFFALEPHAIQEARLFLDEMSRQWDHALAKLKAFVEG